MREFIDSFIPAFQQWIAGLAGSETTTFSELETQKICKGLEDYYFLDINDSRYDLLNTDSARSSENKAKNIRHSKQKITDALGRVGMTLHNHLNTLLRKNCKVPVKLENFKLMFKDFLNTQLFGNLMEHPDDDATDSAEFQIRFRETMDLLDQSISVLHCSTEGSVKQIAIKLKKYLNSLDIHSPSTLALFLLNNQATFRFIALTVKMVELNMLLADANKLMLSLPDKALSDCDAAVESLNQNIGFIQVILREEEIENLQAHALATFGSMSTARKKFNEIRKSLKDMDTLSDERKQLSNQMQDACEEKIEYELLLEQQTNQFARFFEDPDLILLMENMTELQAEITRILPDDRPNSSSREYPGFFAANASPHSSRDFPPPFPGDDFEPITNRSASR